MHIIWVILLVILVLALLWWLRMGVHEYMHQYYAVKYNVAKHPELKWYDILIYPYWVRISKGIRELPPHKQTEVMLAGVRADVMFLFGTFIMWFVFKNSQVLYSAFLISAFMQTLDMVMNLYFSDYEKLIKMLKK